MSQHGYCIVDDVRRVMQETDADFTAGALGEGSNQLVQDAIRGVSRWVHDHTFKHWYDAGGISGDTENVASTSALTRDDEHDLPTHGGYVLGAYTDEPAHWTTTTGTVFDSHTRDADPKEEIRLATGRLADDAADDLNAYTRITLERKNVSAVNELSIVNEDGGYDDWTSTQTGGVGNANRGDDWWVRVNNRGFSELYIDVHVLDDDIQTLNNAVYVDIDYGQDSIPMDVRRGVAHLVAAQLVLDDEFLAGLPDNASIVDVETKATRWERIGLNYLDFHFEGVTPRGERTGPVVGAGA